MKGMPRPEQLRGSYYSHSHVVHTHKTYGDVVKEAWKKATMGFVIFCLAFVVLWFNEAREVKMWALFGRARGMVKEVGDKRVDIENEASLVHVSSTTETDETISATQGFPVTVSNCTKLRMNVEMYQWMEHSKTEEKDASGGGKDVTTTYSYTQDWYAFPIDSSSFNDPSYSNPPMPFTSSAQNAQSVRLGSFNLSARLIDKTCKFQSVASNEMGQMDGWFPYNGCGYSTAAQGQQPAIGAMRVEFSKVPCGPTSVLALQHNQSFSPMTYKMQVKDGKVYSPDGNLAPLLDHADDDDIDFSENDARKMLTGGTCSQICKGSKLIAQCIESREEVYELMEEQVSAHELLDNAIGTQECIHEVLTLVGFVMLVLGLDWMMTFLPTLFRIIPFLGTWVQWILNGGAHICAFVLGGFFWCVTIAVAWLFYRPLKAALLLTVSFAFLSLGMYLANQ
eukprot:TRINITY_DN7669_c0_g1_i1.p1 TRINITY_DN7669_c0_g1~~TRINITY_DN7669_c0_g1_i1.p1  ORF type:complete len:506 (+),score=94.11 TRINITY_DN7669_c0_g1_i1:166-1518(+)